MLTGMLIPLLADCVCVCVCVCLCTCVNLYNCMLLSIFSIIVRVYCFFHTVSTEFEDIDISRRTTANIQLDLSHLEVNDVLKMEFRSTVSANFGQILEGFGEFLRDTATVTIVNGIHVTIYMYKALLT